MLNKTSISKIDFGKTNVDAPLYNVTQVGGKMLLNVNRTKIEMLMKVPNTYDFTPLLYSGKRIDTFVKDYEFFSKFSTQYPFLLVEGQAYFLAIMRTIYENLIIRFHNFSLEHKLMLKHHMYKNIRMKANLISLCLNKH